MYKYIITPLLLCSLTSYAAADDVQIKSNHPDRHVVVKGDTLWDISAKFLNDPWQWPKLWKMNRAEIKNPHLIYPGDVVVFDPNSKTLRLLRETISRDVTLEPGVRVEQLEKEAIQSIAPNIIAPFINQPLVIEKKALDSAVSILGGAESRVAYSEGSKIYLDKVQEGDGRFWHIYRDGKELKDPVTDEVLGIEAIHLGGAQITQYGEPATAEVTQARQEIVKGDKLVVAPDEVKDNFIPHAPDDEIAGQIISVYGGLKEAGRNSIVTINRGTDDGLEVGHVLAIYRDGTTVDNPKYVMPKDAKPKLPELNRDDFDVKKLPNGVWEVNKAKKDPSKLPTPPDKIKLPDQRVGLLMVFRTFERVSYCLVVQAAEPAHELDIVKKP